MITVPQIKAARALLGWTQRDLAKISGVSLAAVAQIESGAGNPRAETMRTLQRAFEKYDVEFSDDPGLRIRQEPFCRQCLAGSRSDPESLEGYRNGLSRDGKGGEVALSSLDDALWKKLLAKELPPAIATAQET